MSSFEATDDAMPWYCPEPSRDVVEEKFLASNDNRLVANDCMPSNWNLLCWKAVFRTYGGGWVSKLKLHQSLMMRLGTSADAQLGGRLETFGIAWQGRNRKHIPPQA